MEIFSSDEAGMVINTNNADTPLCTDSATVYTNSATGTTSPSVTQAQEVQSATMSMDILEISPEAKKQAEIQEFIKDRPFPAHRDSTLTFDPEFIKQVMEEVWSKPPAVSYREYKINAILKGDVSTYLKIDLDERTKQG